MSIDIIFKIAAIGILVAVINQVLEKAGKEEMAMMTTLTGVVIVLLMVVNLINQLFQNIKSIFKLY
ncbi:MAG TPA: stage III sporulation protein AC [Clostridiales bacterium]|nr:stage III sporulation protein AC [Clostridia bacterium]HCS74295.1 stage III sporulation protein AC [Clostridiales bacterium]